MAGRPVQKRDSKSSKVEVRSGAATPTENDLTRHRESLALFPQMEQFCASEFATEMEDERMFLEHQHQKGLDDLCQMAEDLRELATMAQATNSLYKRRQNTEERIHQTQGCSRTDEEESLQIELETPPVSIVAVLRVQSLLQRPFEEALIGSPMLCRHIEEQEDAAAVEKEFRQHWHPGAPLELRLVFEELLDCEAGDDSVGDETSAAALPWYDGALFAPHLAKRDGDAKRFRRLPVPRSRL